MKCKACHSHALNIAPESGYCDVCYFRCHLFNLLAAVHRDGGHYTHTNGVEDSVRRAIEVISWRKRSQSGLFYNPAKKVVK